MVEVLQIYFKCNNAQQQKTKACKNQQKQTAKKYAEVLIPYPIFLNGYGINTSRFKKRKKKEQTTVTKASKKPGKSTYFIAKNCK